MSSVGVDDDDVARGPDAVTMLDNSDIRSKIVDELMEVCEAINSLVIVTVCNV